MTNNDFMKLRNTILSLLLGAGCLSAMPLTVNQPGTLSKTVGEDFATMTSLVIEGAIDASDLEFIAASMPSLTELDLSAATIAEYNGARLLSGLTHSDADVFPAFGLAGAKVTTLTLPASISRIDDGAFIGSSITSVAIPASVSEIGDHAFAGSAIISAEIPTTVVTVGSGLFSDCNSLETVVLPFGVVPEKCFSGCSRLANVTVPNTTEIEAQAFLGCKSLTSIALPATLIRIDDEAFAGSGLESIDLTACKSLTAIGERAFYGIPSLAAVYLPASLSDLGPAAFFGDASLTEINIPESVTKINPLVFKDVQTGNMNLHDGITEIGEYAYHGNTESYTFTVPANLEYIGDHAFEGNVGLEKVDAKATRTVPALGEGVWDGVTTGNIPLDAPEELAEAYKSADQWNQFSITQAGTTGIGAVSDPSLDIIVSLEGDVLTVKSSTAPIYSVSIHDVSGRLIFSVKDLKSNEMSVTLLDIPAGALDVSVTTEIGTRKIEKILKK